MNQHLQQQRAADEKKWGALMQRAQAGDGQAYHQLLSELNSVIEAYIRANFGASPFIEDYVQECILAIHHARHTYDPKRLFRPWLFTIVRHKTIDMLRRAGKHSAESTDEEIDALAHAETMENVERMLDGNRLLDTLPEEQKQAITLTKYVGLTTDEAAKLVNVKESTLKARLRRGIQNITTQWQRDWLKHETKS